MSESLNKQLLESPLYKEWDSLEETALLTNLKPGNKNWLELISSFGLPSTTLFWIGVAVIPGSNWSADLDCFALELVRVVHNRDNPKQKPPDRSRARVLYYSVPVTDGMLRRISPMIPDRHCIEQTRVDDRVVIDVRGVHNTHPNSWLEEIISLLKGAWLLTRENNLLTTSQLRYEVQISAAIEGMAQRGHDHPRPARFTKTLFYACWPLIMSRTNLYNIIPDHRWPDITERYYKRWEELHKSLTERL